MFNLQGTCQSAVLQRNGILNLSQNFQLSLATGFLTIILISIVIVSRIVTDSSPLKLLTANTADFFNKLIGTLMIVSLSFAANNSFVYILAIIIIATLVTKLKFLEMVLALIWNRERYFDYRMEELLKQQEGGKDLPKPAEGSDATYLKTLYFFEVTYRLIFGSQINILLILENTPKVSGVILESLYRRTIWSNSAYTFYSYMNFLVSNGLIGYDNTDDNYYLTQIGKNFLSYIKSNNIPLYKGNT